MIKVKAVIRDENDSTFESEVYANINETDYLIYKDCMDVYSCDEYDKAYDRICACFENQNNLPYDWYFDADIERVGE